jgi:fructokinase
MAPPCGILLPMIDKALRGAVIRHRPDHRVRPTSCATCWFFARGWGPLRDREIRQGGVYALRGAGLEPDMLLSCGDALIDFLPVPSADGNDALLPVVGGSCLNIAVGIARLGAAAGFVGGISTDLFGRMIADHAIGAGVDLQYATRSAHQSTLAFVRSVAGEPQYAFYDAQTASRNWIYRAGVIPLGKIDAIHVGSTTLVDETGAAQTLAMVDEARGSTTISFDPNCRSNIVTDKAEYVKRMDGFAAAADIVRMSDADFEYLYGGQDVAQRAATMLEAGAGLVVVTCGGRGVHAWHRSAGVVQAAAPATVVVDTIGAGDSFQAALLVALQMLGRIGVAALKDATADELRRALSFATKCAAFTCGRAGADPPRRVELGEEVFEQLLEGPVVK